MSEHDVVDIIRTKRDGDVLTSDQVRWTIASYTRGEVAEEQMSALLMAIFLNGLSAEELTHWTEAMIDSGRRMHFALDRPTTDKHSTGGVGDKTTLALAPLVATMGAIVPQLSGRGLGHTGGTLDKLESIPGWRANLTEQEYLETLQTVGAVVCAAGDDLAPADRKLYALRDVTATVDSIPLIASSIMSKKIAEGADALTLDVKVGSGAFMKDLDSARDLARTMVELGRAHGVATSALLTDMTSPLGRSAGNALEVAEALEILAGGGPSDVVEFTVALAQRMLSAVGIAGDPAHVLASGAAMDTWRAMIRAQGGDPLAPLPAARHRHEIRAECDGMLQRLDAFAVGAAAWRLGAGRARKEDSVSATAGVTWSAAVGEQVHTGQQILTLHFDDETRLPRALDALANAFAIVGAEVPDSGRHLPHREYWNLLRCREMGSTDLTRWTSCQSSQFKLAD